MKKLLPSIIIYIIVMTLLNYNKPISLEYIIKLAIGYVIGVSAFYSLKYLIDRFRKWGKSL